MATDVINPVTGYRYIVIKDGENYSAHRIEMYLTHASLRTSQAGLYYKAQYKCDTTLASRVQAYGIRFSVTQTSDSVMEGFADAMENNTVNGTSVAVFGIFKNDRSAAENVAAGKSKIHATPYIKVDVNGDENYDNLFDVQGNVDNDVYKANVAGVVYAAMSLYDVLKSINDDWDRYSPENNDGRDIQAEVQDFYSDWADYGMSQWATELANISGANA